MIRLSKAPSGISRKRHLMKLYGCCIVIAKRKTQNALLICPKWSIQASVVGVSNLSDFTWSKPIAIVGWVLHGWRFLIVQIFDVGGPVSDCQIVGQGRRRGRLGACCNTNPNRHGAVIAGAAGVCCR